MFPSYIRANWQFPFLRVLSFLFLVHGAEPQLWPLCAILFLGVMSPGRVFSLFFSARLWKSFCFTPMNRIERNLENSSLPLQVSLHFFWITQVSIASRQNIWQEVVPCVLIYRSAPFLVKHPASALFTGSSSPWCLTVPLLSDAPSLTLLGNTLCPLEFTFLQPTAGLLLSSIRIFCVPC